MRHYDRLNGPSHSVYRFDLLTIALMNRGRASRCPQGISDGVLPRYTGNLLSMMNR